MNCFKKIGLSFIIICFQIITVFAQGYTVSYKPLPSDLLTGSKPIKIGILEDFKSGEKLYQGLVQDNSIKKQYEIYPASVLDANREMLGGDIDAQNNNFLKQLNDILRIKYLLQWQMIPDSTGFNLAIYSTGSFDKIYDHNFLFSINSTPVNDVKKFLIEKAEPSYTVSIVELQVNGIPENARFKLFRSGELVKEWSGIEKQKIEAGNYELTAEAYGFKSDNREIKISGENPITINVKLEPDVSLMPAISSADNLITNINPELQAGQLKIFYDLNGERENHYDITLTLTDKTTNSSAQIKQVTGDIENVVPGKSKIIIWKYTNEIGSKGLNNYNIKLSANQRGGGIAWYIYAGGGALVLGGAAALLLGGSDEGTTPSPGSVKINPPPGRP